MYIFHNSILPTAFIIPYFQVVSYAFTRSKKTETVHRFSITFFNNMYTVRRLRILMGTDACHGKPTRITCHGKPTRITICTHGQAPASGTALLGTKSFGDVSPYIFFIKLLIWFRLLSGHLLGNRCQFC